MSGTVTDVMVHPVAVASSQATLLWLPVGAGGHVVIHTSHWWEMLVAARERRPTVALFHAALEVVDQGEKYVIEMAPAWGVPASERGVVAHGPVGWRCLVRSRFFRYEVRRWHDGVIPDRLWAVEELIVTTDAATVRQLLELIPQVPQLIWGQTVAPTRDMWNSNSLISWALAKAGIQADLTPPRGGRAPGWAARLAIADHD